MEENIRKRMKKYKPLMETYEDAKIMDREMLSLMECLKKELKEKMCFFLFYNPSLN